MGWMMGWEEKREMALWFYQVGKIMRVKNLDIHSPDLGKHEE